MLVLFMRIQSFFISDLPVLRGCCDSLPHCGRAQFCVDRSGISDTVQGMDADHARQEGSVSGLFGGRPALSGSPILCADNDGRDTAHGGLSVRVAVV